MKYSWQPAVGADIADISAMTWMSINQVDMIYTMNQAAFNKNITHAIVNQMYNPASELVSVARNTAGQLLAYTWAKTGERSCWSTDDVVSVCMALVDPALPMRLRIRLVTDEIMIWEQFAKYAGVSIICSTTMRKDQSAFLRLHEQLGYDVRGSFAYKRVSAT
jgi:hypothetical protein